MPIRLRGLPPLLFVLATGGLAAAACGPSKLPPVKTLPAASVASSAGPSTKPAPPMPPPLAGVTLGPFGEGTFGPRLSRNGKSAILVSAPRSDSGRRWFAVALDDKDQPIDASRHEIAEAPEDASAWDLKPVGDGFVLAWTRASESGEQLLAVALAADGSPRSSPASIAKSGDDLVAVRLVPMGSGALLTWGEKIVPKGGISATGTLFAIPIDALGRASATSATRVAEKLSAWQIAATGPGSAIAAIVQRNEPKTGKDEKLAAREDLARSARAITLGVTNKGIVTSEPTLLSNDDALPEIDVVSVAGDRALVVWSDRRDVDAHLFAVSVDVSGAKPKVLGTPKRAAPPHGDQAIVAMVPSKDGAVVLFEIVAPRSLRDPRRRFELARLSIDGEAVAKPRAFFFPYENDEPELVRAGDDDVAVLTYGQACVARGTDVDCDTKDLRPWLLRFGGPTLSPKQSDVVDVGKLTTGTALHAFDPTCTAARCDVLAEGSGTPATVALARVPARDGDKGDLRWVFREHIESTSTPPRLEGATAVAREPEFTGLHAVRAGAGSLVGWITYAPDDIDLEALPEEPKPKKGDKAAKPKPKKAKPATTGARVGVRLLDGAGEPVGPISIVSEKALSKGDVAVAWSLLEPKGEGKKAEGAGGLVAYVSRAEGAEDVYVARIDGKGLKAGKSSRVTNTKGPTSDVALTALPEGGYLLGWVEARKDGAPAVYAVRLDKSGQKAAPEVKVGGGVAGDVSDLSLVTLGSGAAGVRVVAVWSDARDDAAHGYGDVYYAMLGTKDLNKPVLSERPLARTKTHSHYPVVTARGDGGAVLAWVEDDPSATEFLESVGRPEWGARLARIDAQGTVVQTATEIALDPALGKGVATGVGLDCPSGPASCRLAIAWATREGIAVLGAPLGAATPPPARVVWSWFGAPSQEVAPSIVGTTIYAAEDGLEKDDGRVRRLSIAW